MNCPVPTIPVPADPFLPVSQVSTVFLFNPDTGAIAHIHQETTLAGGVVPTAAQMEATAKRVFSRSQPAANQAVATLILNSAANAIMCPGMTYKVVNCQVVPG